MPVVLPYKTMFSLDRSLKTPLYIQLSNEVIRCIIGGQIPVSAKLPGARRMGTLLGLSRRTIVMAYEELDAQGWLDIIPSKGCFVNSKLPIKQYSTLGDPLVVSKSKTKRRKQSKHLSFINFPNPIDRKDVLFTFDTGYPDVRLAPLKALGQRFNRVLNSKTYDRIMNYAAHFGGHPHLKSSMRKYLAETRGIKTDEEHLLITRGSLMAFNLIFQTLLNTGDKVVVGDLSFQVAKDIIKIHRGVLRTVPVDEFGMDIDAIEKICQKEDITAVFVMPHHHHPTTVSLPAERRVKLLMLAQRYGFYIVEDDYDYDFHYDSSPILPMASADPDGVVIYVGSFSKIVAPGLRTGFIVAPASFISRATSLSRFIDCHGNSALEKAISLLIDEGIINRHLKKSLKEYKVRRDLFCDLLEDQLGHVAFYNKPEGGLAIWVNFTEDCPLADLRTQALKNGLVISRTDFELRRGTPINAIRMGFASLDQGELVAAVNLLAKSIRQIV